jgi:hypothetical protein
LNASLLCCFSRSTNSSSLYISAVVNKSKKCLQIYEDIDLLKGNCG